MKVELLFGLCVCLLAISFLYSSVGHAGASGYLAIMSLFGLSPEFIRPAALVLNIVVAGMAAWQFYRAGYFHWPTFWPLAVLSLPCAFLGGCIEVPVQVFKLLLGMVLLVAAGLLLVRMKTADEANLPPRAVSLAVGAGLGFVAGVTGTGGGIFLTPVLILFRWTKTKTASSISALFILVNSIAGLLGVAAHARQLPAADALAPMLITVLVGGTIGSYLGSRIFSREVIKRMLAVVLAIASFKLMLG